MMLSVKRAVISAAIAISVCTPLLFGSGALAADKHDKPKDKIEKPLAGPRATILRETPLYISPDTGSQRVDRVQEGRELVIAETSGAWIQIGRAHV